jgi:hypothetical protein
MVVRCKICGGESIPFDTVDFNKACSSKLYPLGLCAIPVTYMACCQCQFVFTDFFEGFSPEQWQRHIYNADYIKVDPEYLTGRPRQNADQIAGLLEKAKDSVVGLDYGGGNGKTVSLLREDGWAFDAYDPFGYTDMSPDRVGRYNFCSAMEVFEHLSDPIASLGDIVSKAAPGRLSILIGTLTLDGIVTPESRLSWWYAAPRNGHISLYSRKSLQLLGAKFGLTYSCIGSYPHLLTRGLSRREAQAWLLRGKLRRVLRASLKRLRVSSS